MTQGIERQAFYFKKKGPTNTDKTLEIALSLCSLPFRHQDQGRTMHACSLVTLAVKRGRKGKELITKGVTDTVLWED